MIQIQRNEIISKDNRKLKIYLSAGATPVVPFDLYFAVFEINSPEKVLNPVKVFPLAMDKYPVDIVNDTAHGGDKEADGVYIAQFQMDASASLGRGMIRWYYRTVDGAPFSTFEEEFEVIDYLRVYGSKGPSILSIGEIRTFLRDVPQHHVLIDNYMFTDSDISTAIDFVINDFNVLNPPIGVFNQGNFPDKHLLLMGVAGWLFDAEANHQLMEQLSYQDGNIHHGITDKTQLYREAAASFKTAFYASAKELKIRLNIESIYDGHGEGVLFNYKRIVTR